MSSSELAQYAGTLPQWLLLGSVVIAAIKLIPRMSELRIGEAGTLRKELVEQAKECEATKARLNNRIDELQELLFGEKRNRVAEQISLIGLIMKSAPDTAEFQGMLRVLSAVQDQIEREHPSQSVKQVSLQDSGEGAEQGA